MIYVIYGYIRVSTYEQNEARQFNAMLSENCPISNIYVDKSSGKDFNRPQYNKMIKRMKKDDLLIIKSIDRLGRNYTEIQEQWRILTKQKGCDIYVLDMPLLDTRREKDLLGTFISDVVLQVLSFVADHERELILTRQAEGIAAAKAKGVRFGRPPADLSADFAEYLKKWRSGELTAKEAAYALSMPVSTFRYRAANFENYIADPRD